MAVAPILSIEVQELIARVSNRIGNRRDRRYHQSTSAGNAPHHKAAHRCFRKVRFLFLRERLGRTRD